MASITTPTESSPLIIRKNVSYFACSKIRTNKTTKYAVVIALLIITYLSLYFHVYQTHKSKPNVTNPITPKTQNSDFISFYEMHGMNNNNKRNANPYYIGLLSLQQNSTLLPYNSPDSAFVHRNQTFTNYHKFISNLNNSNDHDTSSNGLNAFMLEIVNWIQTMSDRDDIKAFSAQWMDVIQPTNNEEMVIIDALLKEISFESKDFVHYFNRLLNYKTDANHSNEDIERPLWETYNFANKQFDALNVNISDVLSFGAGLGFGFQIFCDDALILDAGAGGGGGFNKNDKPTPFQFGGGGGIQIMMNHNNNNNRSYIKEVSIGGGMGYEGDKPTLDSNANVSMFYKDAVPYFIDDLKNKTKCHYINVQSGGGSGGGYTNDQNVTNLAGWSFFTFNFTLQ